jgi:hypothetical protein
MIVLDAHIWPRGYARDCGFGCKCNEGQGDLREAPSKLHYEIGNTERWALGEERAGMTDKLG